MGDVTRPASLVRGTPGCTSRGTHGPARCGDNDNRGSHSKLGRQPGRHGTAGGRRSPGGHGTASRRRSPCAHGDRSPARGARRRSGNRGRGEPEPGQFGRPAGGRGYLRLAVRLLCGPAPEPGRHPPARFLLGTACGRRDRDLRSQPGITRCLPPAHDRRPARPGHRVVPARPPRAAAAGRRAHPPVPRPRPGHSGRSRHGAGVGSDRAGHPGGQPWPPGRLRRGSTAVPQPGGSADRRPRRPSPVPCSRTPPAGNGPASPASCTMWSRTMSP